MNKFTNFVKFSLLGLIIFIVSCNVNRDNSVQSGNYRVSYKEGWFDGMMQWLLTYGVGIIFLVILVLIARALWNRGGPRD